MPVFLVHVQCMKLTWKCSFWFFLNTSIYFVFCFAFSRKEYNPCVTYIYCTPKHTFFKCIISSCWTNSIWRIRCFFVCILLPSVVRAEITLISERPLLLGLWGGGVSSLVYEALLVTRTNKDQQGPTWHLPLNIYT